MSTILILLVLCLFGFFGKGAQKFAEDVMQSMGIGFILLVVVLVIISVFSR